MDIYYRLLNAYGYQNWWPAETRYEVVVGAILTQNTSWKNVERAIKNLKDKDLLKEERILNLGLDELKSLIKPAGFYNIKAERLKEVTKFIVNNYGDTNNMALSKEPTEILRRKLLSVKGVGKETADSILLYALDRKNFVVDNYTKRLFNRLGLISEKDYDKIKKFFESNILNDLEVYKEYHALIVEHCKRVCKKKPKCERCILNNICRFIK
ncbi:endonuclease [Methanocaldococcus sp.]